MQGRNHYSEQESANRGYDSYDRVHFGYLPSELDPSPRVTRARRRRLVTHGKNRAVAQPVRCAVVHHSADAATHRRVAMRGRDDDEEMLTVDAFSPS